MTRLLVEALEAEDARPDATVARTVSLLTRLPVIVARPRPAVIIVDTSVMVDMVAVVAAMTADMIVDMTDQTEDTIAVMAIAVMTVATIVAMTAVMEARAVATTVVVMEVVKVVAALPPDVLELSTGKECSLTIIWRTCPA